MLYAPHTLYKRVIPAESVDEYGRPIVLDSDEEWEKVCGCRCDDNGDNEVVMPDGTVVVPTYHIVIGENNPDVKTGDYVRCLKDDGTVRGEGHIVKKKTINYWPYAEIYV